MKRTEKSRWAMVLTLSLAQFSTPIASFADWPTIHWVTNRVKYHGKAPEMCEDKAIEELAKNIDWLNRA